MLINDVWYEILNKLDINNQLRTRRVCRAFKSIMEEEIFSKYRKNPKYIPKDSLYLSPFKNIDKPRLWSNNQRDIEIITGTSFAWVTVAPKEFSNTISVCRITIRKLVLLNIYSNIDDKVLEKCMNLTIVETNYGRIFSPNSYIPNLQKFKMKSDIAILSELPFYNNLRKMKFIEKYQFNHSWDYSSKTIIFSYKDIDNILSPSLIVGLSFEYDWPDMFSLLSRDIKKYIHQIKFLTLNLMGLNRIFFPELINLFNDIDRSNIRELKILVNSEVIDQAFEIIIPNFLQCKKITIMENWHLETYACEIPPAMKGYYSRDIGYITKTNKLVFIKK